jgi:hypothetical protein
MSLTAPALDAFHQSLLCYKIARQSCSKAVRAPNGVRSIKELIVKRRIIIWQLIHGTANTN